MAEAFGIVSGVASLPSIFTAAVGCFQYIQLGRNFEQDYTQHLVHLKLLETRFTRWGAAVGIYDDQLRLNNPNATSEDLNTVNVVVHQILQLFSKSKEQSKSGKPSQRAEFYKAENISEPNRADLIRQASAISSKRTKGPGKLELVSWVVYKREHLKELLDGIVKLLDQLEELFPAQEARGRLADEDLRAICTSVQFGVLQEVTVGIDKLLEDRSRGMIASRNGNYYGTINSTGGQTSNGNVYIDAQAASGFVTPTGGNTYNEVNVSNEAKVHNGDWFGKSPFG